MIISHAKVVVVALPSGRLVCTRILAVHLQLSHQTLAPMPHEMLIHSLMITRRGNLDKPSYARYCSYWHFMATARVGPNLCSSFKHEGE